MLYVFCLHRAIPGDKMMRKGEIPAKPKTDIRFLLSAQRTTNASPAGRDASNERRVNVKKRLLSLFLCVMMLLTLVPVTALAQDVGDADTGSEAAAQEPVQEPQEDAAEDTVPTEPVQPAVPVEDVEPAQTVVNEVIADESERSVEMNYTGFTRYGKDPVTIGGPQDRIEHEDGYIEYQMNGWKSESRLEFDLVDGTTFRGTISEIEEHFGVTASFTSDQSKETPWHSGESHQFVLKMTGEDGTVFVDDTINVVVKDNDVTGLSVPSTLYVTKGNDAYITIYGAYSENEYAELKYWHVIPGWETWTPQWVVTDGGKANTYSEAALLEKYDDEPGSIAIEEDHDWDVGQNSIEVEFLGRIYKIPVVVEEPKYELVDFQYTGETVQLIEGIGMYEDQYNLPNISFDVTYKENGRSVEKTLTMQEIYELFDRKVFVTYKSNQEFNKLENKSWQVGGGPYRFYVALLDKMTTVPVTLTESPFDELKLEKENSASLLPYNMGYFDARILAGADEYTGFTAPKFVLTTKEGQTYNGKTELTGTLQQLSDQLGIDLYGSFTLEGDTDIETWKTGAARDFTVTFCGLTCNVVAFRASLPITAIQWSEQNTEELTVTKGYDASECYNGSFAYSPYIEDMLFDITFSESGKSRYNLEQDTYTWTLEQLAAKTGFGVILDTQSQFEGLTPDENGLVYLTYMLEKDSTYYPEFSCKVPVRLMDYDGKVSVESVTYAGDPLRLVNGADGYKSNSGFIYNFGAASDGGRFQLKVTLSDEESFTGTPDDVGYYLSDKLGRYYFVKRDYADDELQEAALWNVGETHKLRAYLCGIPFEVPVELVEGTWRTLDEETFPDAKFRAYLEEEFGQDGYVIIEAVTAINCYDEGITSLDGIETFKRLRYLDCSGNRLETLDVSANTALTELYCYDNQLTKLDIGENTELRELACYNNQLTELDVSKSIKLIKLSCYQNQLSDLNVRNNAELAYLDCDDNRLNALDVSQNTALSVLWCCDCGLTELDVSKNINLEELYCYGDNLKTLDVTNNSLLENLACHYNQLTELKLGTKEKLRTLTCFGNQLTELDISGCPALVHLNGGSNLYTTLDTSNNPELGFLACDWCPLTSLDVSKNTKLTTLYCDNNPDSGHKGLTELDVSHNSELDGLTCSNNQLTELDLSSNTKLTYLDCSGNKLSRLDVSGNTNLCRLDCSDNGMTELYLPGSSSETILSRIAGYFSPATYAEETADTALEYLDCSRNKLTEVDASTCTKLKELTCIGNQGKQLTVSVAALEGLNLTTVGTEGPVTIKQDGDPMQGVTVSGTMNVDEVTLTLLDQDGAAAYETTVYDKQFLFHAVADGSYTLTAEMRGYVTRSETVTVENGTVRGLEGFMLAELGDVNLDGVLDVYDLQRLYEHVTGINQLIGYAAQVSDVNRDNDTSERSILDLQRLYDQLVNGSGKSGVNSAMTG